MSKNKHLSLDDRCKIQLMLDNKGSFSSIATQLEKDPTTISKEVSPHHSVHSMLSRTLLSSVQVTTMAETA